MSPSTVFERGQGAMRERWPDQPGLASNAANHAQPFSACLFRPIQASIAARARHRRGSRPAPPPAAMRRLREHPALALLSDRAPALS
ncbi:hypothetical protein AcW2_005125 [Taiwanofungus camphoratus]|nr:hypothetical protein AcW2_005125 [Antrodia cinnamomea]